MITVVSPTDIWPNTHAMAIMRTRQALPLASKGLLICPFKPTIAFDGEWVELPLEWWPRRAWNKVEYSRFMIQGLTDFIDTPFCITCQWDGYGLNRGRWTNSFFNYDYIGAPWPSYMNIGRVGNGGFSLRSKRWLDAAANPFTSPPYQSEAEDDYMCNRHVAFYKSKGCNIAPVDVAQKFSLEWPVEEFPGWTSRESFGFHGFFTDSTKAFRMPQF